MDNTAEYAALRTRWEIPESDDIRGHVHCAKGVVTNYK